MTSTTTRGSAVESSSATRRTSPLNTTYYRLELVRLLRDRAGLFFIAGLPAFLYLLFGATPDYADEPINDGNVAMWIMIAMAAYGAVSGTTGVGGWAALDRMQGWGRQLGLTPMTDGQYVAVKTAVATTIAALPIGLVYAAGALTGARAPWTVWLASAAILLVGATTFSLYGLSFGLAFRSESAVSVAAGSLVVLSFLGNIFVPLSGTMLTVARFTPLYGYVALARWPLTGGGTIDTETGDLITEPLWQPVTNVVVWTLVLGAASVLLVRRGRARV